MNKTAEEVFQSRYRAGADGWMDQKSVLECMREYGRQCAEQALKDAAERTYALDDPSSMQIERCILLTQITTP